jgi:8-oxo-dGTP pyrophosphatase MutT (NUDIX family)
MILASPCGAGALGMAAETMAISLPDQANHITLPILEKAMALPAFDALAAQALMAPRPRPFRPSEAPGQPKQAGVLVLAFPAEHIKGTLSLVLMRRTESGGTHSGQISFPGGRCEEGESLTRTALREAEEELGIPASEVHVLGALNRLYIPPSDFDVLPTVGYLPRRPAWHPQHSEVAEVLETPLSILLDESIKGGETHQRNGVDFYISFYHIGGHKVWGATAIMLSELEMRLRQALA